MALSKRKQHKLAYQARLALFPEYYCETNWDGAKRDYLRTGSLQRLEWYLPELVPAARALNEKYGQLGLLN